MRRRCGCGFSITPQTTQCLRGIGLPARAGFEIRRIRESNVKWLLPSHGPIFRKDNALLDKAIERLNGYLHMADWGTCAIDWPLMDEWDKELEAGVMPGEA